MLMFVIFANCSKFEFFVKVVPVNISFKGVDVFFYIGLARGRRMF